MVSHALHLHVLSDIEHDISQMGDHAWNRQERCHEEILTRGSDWRWKATSSGLEKEAKVKEEDARSKRKSYEEIEAEKETLEREASDAAAAQSQAQHTRATLQRELHEYSSHLEKIETRLVTVRIYKPTSRGMQICRSYPKHTLYNGSSISSLTSCLPKLVILLLMLHSHLVFCCPELKPVVE